MEKKQPTGKKNVTVKLEVSLDEKNIPEKISWHSTDNSNQENINVNAFILALWDPNYKNTLRLDLWTKEMTVEDMYRFFYETLETMGDTLQKSTANEEIIEELRAFNKKFAQKTNLLKP